MNYGYVKECPCFLEIHVEVFKDHGTSCLKVSKKNNNELLMFEEPGWSTGGDSLYSYFKVVSKIKILVLNQKWIYIYLSIYVCIYAYISFLFVSQSPNTMLAVIQRIFSKCPRNQEQTALKQTKQGQISGRSSTSIFCDNNSGNPA